MLFGIDQRIYRFHVIVRYRDALIRCESTCLGIVGARRGDPAVASCGGQNDQRHAGGWQGCIIILSKNVMSGHQTGIIFQSEEIAQSRIDVNGGTGGIHSNRLFHAAAPQNQRVAVAGNVQLAVLRAAELLVVICFVSHQRVGIVVCCETDHGIIGNPSLLQLLHKIFQRIFQFQISGNVALHRLRGIGIGCFCRFSVLSCHGIRAPAPVGVSADSHIIGMERCAVFDIIVYIAGNRQFHHFQI